MTLGLSYRNIELLQARMVAAVGAPPSSKVMLPMAKEAAAKGQNAAMASRRPAVVRAYPSGNVVRISATGPGAQIASRRAMLHVEGRLLQVMDEVYKNTVRALGGKVQ